MSKRTKIVFSSNSQLAHVWAQQTQAEGRGNNTFFDGASIFSYGRHFETGRIVTYKGKRIALLNSDTYSNTTAKHKNEALRAVVGLMPYVSVPGLTEISSTSKAMTAALQAKDDAIESALVRAEKIVRMTSRHDASWSLDAIEQAVTERNELAEMMGRKPVNVPVGRLDAIKSHLKARYARFLELQTPEMQAKRERERAKREALKTAKAIKAEETKIADFRAGKSVYIRLPHELLRIQGDEVITSKGARVPLVAAQAALKKILKNGVEASFGDRIGHFTVNGATYVENDALIEIGCHRVWLSEAKNVLGAARTLKLVGGAA